MISTNSKKYTNFVRVILTMDQLIKVSKKLKNLFIIKITSAQIKD